MESVRRLLLPRCALALTALAFTMIPLLPGMSAAAAPPEAIPLDMVVAVDESGSLAAEDIAREVEATSLIAQSILNTKSRVTVLGFASDNGKDGQNAIDEVCSTTVADAVGRQYLADCGKKIHRRTEKEGNDTDHVAALSQALSILTTGSPPNALKVVFLLTDGELDVRRSPAYGNGKETDPTLGDRRNEAARQQLDTLIAQAGKAGVQIWPLGFGAKVTQDALEKFATGGSREGCDTRTESQPSARIVHSSHDVRTTLLQVYAQATCSRLSRTDSGELEPGATRDLKVDIPLIATDGILTVAKGHPSVRVTFLDPTGQEVPSNGTASESNFTRSGENTTVEALRIVNPLNGDWTIRLRAPATLAKQVVSATALWQGAMQAAIHSERTVVRPGQDIAVTLHLITRRGAIKDEKALQGLVPTVRASGAGLPQEQSVSVRDDGQAPDDRAHDGRYAGTFKAPATKGEVTFTGDVTGPGIRAERVPVSVRISEADAVVQGLVELPRDEVVHAGTTLTGRLTARNASDGPKKVSLRLTGQPPAGVSLTPTSPFELPVGDSTREFTIEFGKDTPLGETSMAVHLADVTDPAKVYASAMLSVTVEPPPTWVDEYRPYLIAALAALMLIALALWQRRRAWRAKVAVRGLRAWLTIDGEPASRELNAPNRWSREFRFSVREPDGGTVLLLPPRPSGEDDVYTARRQSDTGVLLRTPDGGEESVAFGAESEPLPSGLRIAFGDTRRIRRRRPGRASRPGPAEHEDHEDPKRDESDAHQTTSDYDNPWL